MRRLALIGVAMLGVVLSCGRDVTAPRGESGLSLLHGNFAVEPQFPGVLEQTSGAGGAVPFTRVRIVLRHADGTIALDTTVNFPVGADSVPLVLKVPLLATTPSSGEPLSLNLGYVNAAGDTVFRGGPATINVTPTVPGSPPPPAVQIPVKYSGVGANAASVKIAPRALSLTGGATFSFTAQAFDAANTPLAGTPIVWSSLDPTRATITVAGAGTALNARGSARIVAQLLTGPADTVLVNVQPTPATIAAVSGGAQSGTVKKALGAPLVVRVTAGDGLGVSGVTVNFAVTSGGGSVTAAATTDGNGFAQSNWTLGATIGAQSATASVSGLGGSPVTFTATGVAGAATQLAFGTLAPTLPAATPFSAIVTVKDADGNIATAFNGPVTLALQSNPAADAINGPTTVNAVGGVATFAGISLRKVAAGVTLTATSTGIAGVTSSAFDVVAGTPSKLVFTSQPAAALAGGSIGAITVQAQDAGDNPTPAFTGSVTLGFALNPSGGTLTGTTTANAVAGVASFSGLSINVPGVGYALSATASGLAAGTSNTFNIVSGAATNIGVFSGSGQTAPPYSTLTPIVFIVTDAAGNPKAGVTVAFAVATGGGLVTPASGVTDAQGKITASWTLGAVAGLQSITATSAGLTQSPLTVTATAGGAGAAAKVVITTQPTNAVAGVAISPTVIVAVKDALNNVVTSFGGTVSLAIGTNPGGATLGGTASVTAVSGVATFPTVSLNKAGAGYTLVASSGTLTTATSGTFNISAAAAANIAVTAGQSQTALAGTALATQLGATVTDAFGNPVSGVTVNWATPSGGSLLPASGPTNALGVAATTWTLGASPGAQTATAASGTLTGSPLTFNATATLAGYNKVWTGATSTAWSTATNWSPNGVPVTGDSVFVPATTNLPILGASASIKHLNLQGTAALTLSASPTLTITGNLQIGTGSIAGVGVVDLNGTGSAVGTISPATTVSGTYTLSGTLNSGGSVTVTGSLDLNGNVLTLPGVFSTSGSGTITMTSGSPLLSASGDVQFAGGSETGKITVGTIVVGGNFTQSSGATSFVASGTNTVQFTATVAKTITIGNPTTALFQAVTFGNTGGVTLASNMQTQGSVAIVSGSVTGAGQTLTIGGGLQDGSTQLAVSNLVFGGFTNFAGTTPTINAAVSFNAGTPQLSGNLTINGNVSIGGLATLSPSGHALTINGALSTVGSGALKMTGSSDAVTVSGNASFGGGSEATLLTNGVLTIGGSFSQTSGAQGFTATSLHITRFTGAPTIGFANPATSGFGRVEFTGTGSPTATTDFRTASDVWLKTGGPGTITYAGTVTIGGSLYDTAGGRWNVTNTTLTGTNPNTPKVFANNLTFTGSSTLADSLIVNGNLNVTGTGAALQLNGHKVRVGGAFNTLTNGVLQMTNGADTLISVGTATFNGGPTTSLITAGTLIIRSAMYSSGQAFDASGTHTTVVNSPAFQTLGWTSAIANRGYNHLKFDSAGTKNFSGDQFIKGNVTLGVNSGIVNGSYNIGWYGTTLTDLTATNPSKWQPGSWTIRGTPTTMPTSFSINTITFMNGGTIALPGNLSANYVTVDTNTTLNLNGHLVKCNGNYFTTQNGGVLQMTTLGDSLEANQAYFNGGSTAGLLTKGGIAIVGSVFGTLYQGYSSAGTLVANASATSFSSSGTRAWFNPPFLTGVAFKNPGSGATASHFSFVQALSSNPVRLKTSVFVDSMLTGEVSGATWQSDSAAQGVVRTVTTNGIYNSGTSGMTMQGVNIVLNDGPGSSTFFNSVTWQSFPSNYTGALFTSNRSLFGTPSMNFHNYAAVTFGTGGQFIFNAGSLSLVLGGANNPSICVGTFLTGQGCH